MNTRTNSGKNIASWCFAAIIFTLGVLNIIYVDPRPGIIYILASILFIPQTNALLKKTLRVEIPFAVKTVLFLIIIWFTMGISDLAEVLGL